MTAARTKARRYVKKEVDVHPDTTFRFTPITETFAYLDLELP
jgi:hypothetical protein